MKRGKLFLLILILLPMVAAGPEIVFQNEDILMGEPIIGTIVFNGTYNDEILNEDLKFYKGRRETFFESNIEFHEGTHYFYIFANRAGDFRLEINTLYYEDEIFKSETLIKNFTINESGNETLEIRPALIDLNSEKKITLRNVGNNSLNISFNDKDIGLSSLESYIISLGSTEPLEFLEIKTYKTFNIPIFSVIFKDITLNNSNNDLRTDKDSLKFITTLDSKEVSYLEIFNFGENNLTDLEFVSSTKDIITVDLEELIVGGSANISINFDPSKEGNFNEFLEINYLIKEESYNVTIPIEIFVLPAGTNKTDLIESSETCSDLGGSICGNMERCEGRPRFSNGGDLCCIGTCNEEEVEEEESSNKWIIGLLIFAALALGGYGVYDKVKKAKPKTPSQSIVEKSKTFSKRISGGLVRT